MPCTVLDTSKVTVLSSRTALLALSQSPSSLTPIIPGWERETDSKSQSWGMSLEPTWGPAGSSWTRLTTCFFKESFAEG